jgi:hypothetical protein
MRVARVAAPPPPACAHALPDCQFGLAQQNLQCPWHAMHFHAHVPCHAVRCCGVLSVVLCGFVWAECLAEMFFFRKNDLVSLILFFPGERPTQVS